MVVGHQWKENNLLLVKCNKLGTIPYVLNQNGDICRCQVTSRFYLTAIE